jgi:N-carbamoylputrescine amidase
MALAGAELLIYPTAIGYDPNDTREEQERQRMAWQTVQRGHAVANGLPVVTVNRVGNEDGVPFWGTSFVAGPQGEIIYEAPKDKEEVALVDVDMQRSEQVRRWWPFLRDRRIENYNDILKRYID